MTRAWHPAAATALLAALLLSGCASVVTDRVVLLPQPDGSPSAVEVTTAGQTLRLDKPYAAAELRDGRLAPTTTDAAAVRAAYGSLLAQQPARPRTFVVQFESNGNRLAVGADAVLAEMRTALAALPAAEVVITGYTDRLGSVEANDRLSLARAEAVRDLLVAGGLARGAISVAGRGEREPVVPTADEMAEARNRRVEIKIR
jgi:outer membrane protein OmpA-like peptidoglycan-associated protein